MKRILIPCISAAFGLLVVLVSYYIPARHYAIGGTGDTVYGFPFAFLIYWNLDLIGSGVDYYPFNMVLDYIFWFVTAFAITVLAQEALFHVASDSSTSH